MKPRMITVAIMALGGQGGGVLQDWIVQLAENAGWTAQATSVAGVAQRTGATIYYVELVEPTPGQVPVLAQMAVPGEVDILIAAELMEAGRAVARGLVTPNRTSVITSTHRTFAVQEKVQPGDGAADSAQVLELLRKAARRVVADDMQALAVKQRSVISEIVRPSITMPSTICPRRALTTMGGLAAAQQSARSCRGMCWWLPQAA